MGHTEAVIDAFPEVELIEDAALREGVIEAWSMAIADNDVSDIDAEPWYPPVQLKIGLEDATLVGHVRDVTQCALGLADALEDRDNSGFSRDLVIAGALVHDVSKLYEFHGTETTDIGSFLVHPHFGLHVVTAAGLPLSIQHIVISHSPQTGVEPATLEAEIVSNADEVAASSLVLNAVDDLRDV